MAVKRFPVEAGHILMFARSIGDPNPVYEDEEHARGTEAGAIIAPPTFVQASAQFDPDYFLRPKPGQPWFGSGKEPTGVTREPGAVAVGGGGGLHAEQHYEYHRPLRAGDVLTATTTPGTTWEKEGRGPGSSCSPRASPSTGTRTASSWSRPGASASAPSGRWRADMALKASELEVGATFEATLVEDLKRTQIVQYAGASGDYNPLHTDEVFATKVAGYPSVFAHGMLTMGMTGRLLTDTVGDGRLTRFGGRFTSQVWPGDTLTARARVEAVREEDGQHVVDLSVETANQDGVTVFSGSATARVDP
jgi:acyl dehydratase